MARPLLSAIARSLPSETQFENRLRDLSLRDRDAVLTHFGRSLPEFGLVIALPDAEKMGRALARSHGAQVVLAQPSNAGPLDGSVGGTAQRWSLPAPAAQTGELHTAVIVTRHLQCGLPELLVALLAARRGWSVRAVAAVVERSNFQGRTRLELQGIAVHAALQIADTPRGLELERRFPHPE